MPGSTSATPALAARGRFTAVLLGWALLFVAMPGCVLRDGSLLLAILGVAFWGRAVLRPLGSRPRRALLAELLANGLGMLGSMWWIVYVVPPGLLYIALGFGVYLTLASGAVRLLARRLPPGVALALGWLGVETLRTVLPPPFGLGWFLLGQYAHATGWIAGSARVVGPEGLTLVVAALGGVVLELLERRRVGRGTLALGAGALLGAVLLAALTRPPATREGPTVMIVQPAFPQIVKQARDPLENHRDLRRLTLEALAARERAGEPAVDLVAWGETMLQFELHEAGVLAALEAGLRAPPWWDVFDRERVERWREIEDVLVRQDLLDQLPAGTSFLSGAVVVDAGEERFRRHNAVVLYDPEGRRGPAVSKRFLVPGAETMLGLERFRWVRDAAHAAMGYLPDFAPAEETGVLELGTGDGETYRLATSVCFDNAFPEVYTEPVRDGPVDLHLVVSNEAWYRDSFEMDQMVAFSRVAAIASGRSIVRVTNSGVSLVLGPDGELLDRLERDGRDRSVAGTLTVAVPVPVDVSSRPPYPGLRTPLRWGIAGLFLLFLGTCLRGRSGASSEVPGTAR
jgi:apolipoprotein N-acyltransferase